MRNSIIISVLLLSVISCVPKESSDSQGGDPEVMQWLSFEGNEGMPHVVLVSGDEEYRSEEALPQLARILNTNHGFNCMVLFAQDPEVPGVINPNYLNHIPGLKLLSDADLMVIFTRFRALPDDEMKHIDDYLMAGKPVIGIRTSTHAFDFRDTTFESSYRHYSNFHNEDDEWKDGFGRLVLGEKWISHHGRHRYQSTLGIAAPGRENHPILNGLGEVDIWGPSDVYGVRLPLPGDSEPLVMGQVIDATQAYDENDPFYGLLPSDSVIATKKIIKNRREGTETMINPNDPMMPIVWAKSYQLPGGKAGKALTSTIGASTDMASEGTRRLLVNGVFWMLDLEVPVEANVNVIGEFKPTAFDFKGPEYWVERDLKVQDLN